MNDEEISQYITATFAGVDVVAGADASFFFYNPDPTVPPDHRFPFVTLVTMRGEWAEFNPWQVPMGQGTRAALENAGVIVYRVDTVEEVCPTVEAALALAFQSRVRVAVLLSQKLIGAKNFAGGEK